MSGRHTKKGGCRAPGAGASGKLLGEVTLELGLYLPGQEGAERQRQGKKEGGAARSQHQGPNSTTSAGDMLGFV